MKKIQFVTGLHGNEIMPVLALASAGYGQIVGNPLAISNGVRFIDMDLNKTFGLKGNMREERVARKILEKIPKDSFLVDFHSNSCCEEPFAIVVDLKMVPFAKTLGLSKIVYMKHNINNGHALINSRNGVSVEVGTHKNQKSFSTTLEIAKNALKGLVFPKKMKLYEVYAIITKRGDYKNFELFKGDKESFYPVLSGEKAYDFYGLKARIIKEE